MASKVESRTAPETAVAPDPAPAPGLSALAPSRLSAARLLALQRTAGNVAVGRLVSSVRPAPRRSVQRTPGDLSANDLLLQVLFRTSTVDWSIPRDRLDTAVVSLLEGDKAQIAAIEAAILAALTPGGQPVHETTVYLESPAVFEDLVKDVNGWPGAHALPLLARKLAERNAALQATSVLYPAQQELERTGVDPASLDWAAQAETLKTLPQEPVNVLDAAHADRYDAAVGRLADEVASAHPEAGTGPLHTAALGRYFWDVLTADGAAGPGADQMLHTRSEAFLAQWLPTIDGIRLVPDGFDLEAFRPPAEGEADKQREALVKRFIADAAPQAMTAYLLDRWAADPAGRNPDQYIRTADIDALREELLDHLAQQFMKWAGTQTGFTGAMWSSAGQKSAFDALVVMVASARATQQSNAGLHDRFIAANRAQLSPDEWNIASDPAGYADHLTKLSLLTRPLLAGLKPGAGFEGSLLAWWEAAGAALAGSDGSPVALLLAVFNAIGNVKSVISAQKAAARENLRSGLDTSFAAIAGTLRNEAQFAAAFIKEQWIPTLKQVATDRISANKRDLEAQLTDWDAHVAQAAAKFRICGHFLDDIITRLEGDAEAADCDGQTLTKADLPELRTARDFMTGQADVLSDPAKAEKKKDDIQKAVDGFGDVLQNIQSGGYDPQDYSSAVFDEARQRLGIGWYRDFTTVGEALSRFEVANENPFLAYAIARWKWNEQQARLGEQFAVFIGLGLLTVASLLVPGLAGVVLGGLDLALSVGMGIKQVATADDLVDLARLDKDGAVAGISVEQAEKALKTAWIGLGLTTLLTAGIGAIWTRIVFRALGGASKVPVNLVRLSALMNTDAVAAERIIGKVKDFEKTEHLLEVTGDSVLLGRMLDKTKEVRDLEYALLHGAPAKIADLLDLAGDAGALSKILDHAPQLESAEKVLRLADDVNAAATLLEKAANPEIVIALLQWSKRSTSTITRMAGEAMDLDHLWSLSRSIDTVRLDGLLAKGRKLGELDDLIKAGVRVEDIEAGIGVPGGGSVPGAADALEPLPGPVKQLLQEYGIADEAVLQQATPHDARRLRTVFGSNRLPKRAGDTIKLAAARWAVTGAPDAGEVAVRWEYLKTRYDDIRDPLSAAAFPNQSLDAVAGRKLAQELQLGQLDAQIAADIARSDALAGSGWTPLSGTGDLGPMVKEVANKLTFASDSRTAYHVRKHVAELPLDERPPDTAGFDQKLSAYLGSARRTIATQPATIDGNNVTFVRTYTDAAGGQQTMVARVVVRDGHALLTTYAPPSE